MSQTRKPRLVQKRTPEESVSFPRLPWPSFSQQDTEGFWTFKFHPSATRPKTPVHTSHPVKKTTPSLPLQEDIKSLSELLGQCLHHHIGVPTATGKRRQDTAARIQALAHSLWLEIGGLGWRTTLLRDDSQPHRRSRRNESCRHPQNRHEGVASLG